MDSIELPQTLLKEIGKIRKDPITSAATFLDSTRCFHHSCFKISEQLQDFYAIDSIEGIELKRQLVPILAEDDDWNGLYQRRYVLEKRSTA